MWPSVIALNTIVRTQQATIVMNTPFGNSITTAEHAIAMMFAVARQLPAADASTQAGKWEKNRFMGVEITGKTLGIIGCGNIGSIVAERAIGLRMKVIAFDPFLSEERAMQLGVDKVELAVMNELLLRGDQTVGELRSRAARMEPIADLAALRPVLEDYCTSLGVELAQVLSVPFTKLVPISHRPYGKLYTYA